MKIKIFNWPKEKCIFICALRLLKYLFTKFCIEKNDLHTDKSITAAMPILFVTEKLNIFFRATQQQL